MIGPRTITALLVAASLAPPASAQDPPPFGGFVLQVDGILEPRGVAVAADGTILVTECPRDRVRLFGPDGEPRGAWSPADPAGGPGLCRPHGIAVADDGRVLICDTGNDRVVVLDAEGGWLASAGGHGTGAGQFRGPTGIAVGGGRVCVADTDNARVQLLDLDLAPRGVIGAWGDEDGRFNEVTGVAVTDAGEIFAVDAGRNRVQKFDSGGTLVHAWGEWGTFPGLFSEPSGVAVFGDRVIVTDRLGHRLQVFDAGGRFSEQWGKHALLPRQGEGKIHYPGAVAVAPDGAFVVVAETFENRLQLFGPRGDEKQKLPSMPPKRGLQSHFGSPVDADGLMLTVWEPESRAVVLFDLRGEVPIHVTTFGEPGRRFGQIGRLGALFVDEPARRVTVADEGNARMQVFGVDFDPERPLRYDPLMTRFAKGWPVKGPADLPPAAPIAMDRADDGRVYRLDRRSATVEVLEDGVHVVHAFGGPGVGPGRFRRPTDLAVAGDAVYVVDAGNHRVQVFDLDGSHRTSFGREGMAAGEMLDPFGIAAADDGTVWVTDASLDRVQRFDSSGVFVSEWGSTGRDHGQFFKPRGITLDRGLRLIVVDYGNHRMQGFAPDGDWLITFGIGRAWTKEQLKR